MRNLKLMLEYDGTDFHGFQRQPQQRTVQGVLEERFAALLGEPIQVIGAGRTDAGVHATGQVVNFTTTRPVPLEKLVSVLNAVLPAAVKVQHAEEVEASFHARRSASSRTYLYTIIERDQPSPRLGRFAYVLPAPLDITRMAEAARQLVGRHDFRAFQTRGAATKTTERTLRRLECVREGDRIYLTAEADAFLYQMVRRLVSALIAIGQGNMETGALPQALNGNLRLPPPAPPCGLCLIRVSYEAASRKD